MRSFWPLATLLLLSGAGSNFAGTVELNGITCLFGENMGFLVLQQPGQPKPISFALSEGESRFGIKLLAVDVTNGRAEIEQSGQTQLLRLGFAPNLTLPEMRVIAGVTTSGLSPATSPLTPQEQSEINRFLNEDQDAQRIKLGKPSVAVAYVGAPPPENAKSGSAQGNSSGGSTTGSAAGSGSASSSSDSAANAGTAGPGTAGANNSAASSASNFATDSNSTSNPIADYTKEYWYKTSLGIEQNRLATADQVISGDMQPLPATPLTPPNTPASLIGPDTYFSNHIPGFVCGGSVGD